MERRLCWAKGEEDGAKARGKGGLSGWSVGAERGEGRWVLVSGWEREDEKEKWPEGKGD